MAEVYLYTMTTKEMVALAQSGQWGLFPQNMFDFFPQIISTVPAYSFVVL